MVKNNCLKCIETVDIKALKYIINNSHDIIEFINQKSEFNFTTLKEYLRRSDKNGNINVIYFRNNGLGRMFAEGGLSLQSFPRAVRATLAHKFYYDIDMVNAHPVILSHLCRTKQICETPLLDEYIANRDAILADCKEVADILQSGDSKKLILKIMNGGSYSDRVLFNEHKWLSGFYSEMMKVHNAIAKKYPIRYREVVEQRQKEGINYNHKGSLMNHLLCDKEHSYLMCIINKLKELNAIDNNYVCCFDGVMIPKIVKDDLQIANLLEVLEDELRQKYGIDMRLKIKDMEPVQLDICEDDVSDDDDDCDCGDGTDPHIAVLKSMFSDGDVATYFCYIHKDEFKLYNEVLYYFNGCYWEQSSTGVIYNKLNDIYFSLLDTLNTHFGDKEYIEFYNKTLINKLIKLRTSRNLKNIWESIKFRIEIKDDIWDSNPYLLGFINGTYDLKQNIFRKADKLDYISQIVPYEFKEAEQSEIDFAMQYFNKIFPNESERDFFLKSLSTCLDGKLLENIIFALGNGRNGKDTILTMIMKRVLGDDLYYDAPNSIIIDKIKAGANPEIANMHKKRLIVYSEPNKHAILNCANIKQLTGTEVMPVRGLYSSNNKTKMCCTQFIMQNKLLTMDSPDDAMLNRLYVIPFRAMFRTEEKLAELPSDTQFAYLVDSYYKSIEFFERIKLPFMHILLQYYQIFQKEGNILKNAPKSILDASKKYISDSDNFVNWFNECYKHSDNENDHIKLKDIYEKFKSSDLWANMNKAERRKMTRTKLEQDIIENPTLRAFFRDRIQIDGVRYRSVMVKYRVKSYDIDDSDEE